MTPALRERLARPVADELAALRDERRRLMERLRAISHDVAVLEAAECVYGVVLQEREPPPPGWADLTTRIPIETLERPDWPGARMGQ